MYTELGFPVQTQGNAANKRFRKRIANAKPVRWESEKKVPT